MTEQSNEKDEVYSKPFHFATPEDEGMNIETAIYPNNSVIKRYHMSDGRTAIVRELLGNDMIQIRKTLTGENNEDLLEAKLKNAVYHYAVKIDGKQLPMEDFGLLKMKDYMRITTMAEMLNF